MLPPLEQTRTLARRWLLLSAASLLLSGLLAILLAAARTPVLDSLASDPLFFRRGLVIHVDLALLVWIFSFVAGLFALIPARREPGLLQRGSIIVGLAGVMLILASAGARGSKPILSNYVPVIDHPLFLAGLGTFALGILLAVADRRLLPSSETGEGVIPMSGAARIALRTSAFAVIASLLCFAGSWVSTSRSLVAEAYYENLFWGGGHVLQVASVAAMSGAWLILLQPLVARPILSRRAASIAFGLLLLPALLSPLLAVQGPASPYYRIGFTWMMQWGIFPVILFVLGACVLALLRARVGEPERSGPGRSLSDDAGAESIALASADATPAQALGAPLIGFATSAGLALLGFVLGAMIRGSNTMVPAHYHAAIGAVTASFMAVTYVLLPRLGVAVATPRLARLQPLIFGVGQAVFALGFGVAGHFGMGRKVYGAEQLHRSLPETVGLAVMGVGGLIAAVGGVAFLTIVLLSWRRSQPHAIVRRSHQWIRT